MIRPVKFAPNRVWRVYLGGSGIDALRQMATRGDGHFPEDWIASTSLANNPQYDAPGQGLSRVITDAGEQIFSDYLRSNLSETLGEIHVNKYGANAAFLMKILDAAERLPIQVHPSVPDAKRYFHSDFGKTEAWYVVATRRINGAEPYLMLGFNTELDREKFCQEAMRGTFIAGHSMLLKLAVRPGDCFIIPGGIVHAIGQGITLIEVMEPSDLVVQPECFCGQQHLSDSERWSNAKPEDALKCFDFTAETEEEVRRRCSPVAEFMDECLSRVIPYKSAAHYFEVQKLECRGHYTLINRENRHRAGVVVGGDLELLSGNERLSLKQGEAFFLPYALKSCDFVGNGEVVFALPPTLD